MTQTKAQMRPVIGYALRPTDFNRLWRIKLIVLYHWYFTVGYTGYRGRGFWRQWFRV